MMLGKVKKIITMFFVCVDSPALLKWINKKNLEHFFFHFLRYRVSPGLLIKIEKNDVSTSEKSVLYSQAVSRLTAGNTCKTTALNRCIHADTIIDELARNSGRLRLLEVGTSDGSAALRLLKQNDRISRIVLTDKYNCYYVHERRWGTEYFDALGNHYGTKFLCFLMLQPGLTMHEDMAVKRLDVKNPALSEYYNGSIQQFDIFTDKMPDRFEVIRCSNILNREYFSEEEIRLALGNLKESLVDGGYVVISQNNARYKQGEAVVVLRLLMGEFITIRSINSHDVAKLFPVAEEAELEHIKSV